MSDIVSQTIFFQVGPLLMPTRPGTLGNRRTTKCVRYSPCTILANTWCNVLQVRWCKGPVDNTKRSCECWGPKYKCYKNGLHSCWNISCIAIQPLILIAKTKTIATQRGTNTRTETLKRMAQYRKKNVISSQDNLFWAGCASDSRISPLWKLLHHVLQCRDM